MTWPHGDPSVVVRSVLAQPLYRAQATTSAPPQASLLELAWKWIVDHVLAPLFAPLARAAGAAHGVGTAAGVALVGLALLGLGFVAFRLVMAFVRSRTSRARSAGGAAGVDAAHSSIDWRAAARAAAGRGEYARAIAALFSAALAALDEAAVVAFDAARTPSEYRALVRRSRASAAPPFDDLAERFVRAAYAQAAPVRADFDAAERAYAAFAPAIGA